MWDHDRRSIKPDQVKFMGMGPLSRDSAFNVTAPGARKGSQCVLLVGWLKHDPKDGSPSAPQKHLTSLG